MGLSNIEMENIVKNFRNSNKNILSFWKRVEKASINTLKYKTNTKVNNIEFIYDKDYLFIKLPSQRSLAYYKPQIEIDEKFNREILTYKNINQATKKFEKTYIYGEKLTENIVQAIARDILATKMLDLDKHGYEIIMHVHDEVVLQVDEDVEIDDINEIMERDIN